jgi:hypothetical protein
MLERLLWRARLSAAATWAVRGGVEIPFGSRRSLIELHVFFNLLCHLTDEDSNTHGDVDLPLFAVPGGGYSEDFTHTEEP